MKLLLPLINSDFTQVPLLEVETGSRDFLEHILQSIFCDHDLMSFSKNKIII